jgi:hypothetical protein
MKQVINGGYFQHKKLPRKLKKKVKSFCGFYYKTMDVNVALWYYFSYNHPTIHQGIINRIIL